MYCLMYGQSGLCTIAIIFYTCIWLPLQQLKKALFSTLRFILYGHSYHHLEDDRDSFILCLPVARFQDLQEGCVDDDVCSICLVELEKEDVVSKLNKCGHVFHMGCIEKWLERCQFSCPLCRSLIFDVKSIHRTKHYLGNGNPIF